MEERIARLPKWAQQHIAKLERDKANLRKQLGKIASGDTLVKWRMAGESESYHLPDHAKVFFEVGWDKIAINLSDGFLRVATWHGQLIIQPVASNCVSVYSVK